jgi:hypothetical protein
MSHASTRPSSPPEYSVSFATITVKTLSFWCPTKLFTRVPELESQTLILPSFEAENISEEKTQREYTQSSWLLSDAKQRPEEVSQIRTV